MGVGWDGGGTERGANTPSSPGGREGGRLLTGSFTCGL